MLVVLLAAGLLLRVLAELAYRPALLYIDTMKYLYNAYPGADPVGYKAPLTAILAVGNLSTVAAVQHLLGLAIAVTIYLTLVRRGAPRWLAALAVAPVLLDAYQIQIEQTIMPDVWFEALLVAGLALLLLPAVGPAQADTGSGQAGAGSGQAGAGTTSRRWSRGLGTVIVAGLVLGASATFRQVGEILLLPGLLYLLLAGGGWRTVLVRAGAFTAAFAIPVGGYMAASYLITGHFWLASSTPSISSYGRMATAADCATLRIPRYERALCPAARQRAYGIDWLDHDAASPLKSFVAPAGKNRFAVIASFDRQVLVQQPQRVIAAVAGDGIKLFSLARTSSQGGTPISRWQFQEFYPTYGDWVTLGRHHAVVLGLRLDSGSATITRHVLDRSYGGPAAVSKPLATFLRSYQLDGGATPGPLMALVTLAGLGGSLLVMVRRPAWQRRKLSQACAAFFATGLAVLTMSDAFQFSWRYQLPALVTLPPAGVLGLTIAGSYLFSRPRAAGDAEPADAPELTSPAV